MARSALAARPGLCYERGVSQSDHRAANAAVYAFTPQGALLGRRIADALDAELFLPRRLVDALADGPDAPHSLRAVPFDSLAALMDAQFHFRKKHVFVAAAGVAVRAAAPHLRGKAEDPAVVALDQEGRFCISLLSGHLGGANALAREVAAMVGAQPVITTATDSAGLPALDELGPRLGLRIANLHAAKAVSAALLAKGRPQLFDPLDLLAGAGVDPGLFQLVPAPEAWTPDRAGAWVHWRAAPPGALGLHPPCLHAGVGCRRDTPAEEILALIETTFAQRGLSLASLAGLASIEAKADEPGLLLAAERLGAPLTFFTTDQLAEIRVPSPSALVRKHMGVDSVCEAAAMLASRGSLIVPKTRIPTATLAVAVSSWSASAPAERTT
ncbi:cobalt-precorrin 5A hydrolase [Paucidesulfovibrio longus]|uniref:cobalt-precorrin 5A hydrolase n=1 Tax=Paucidesulfovibrio longus TaxID=889 RepID=UPI0003B2F78A|nr:cobalamin biosynthesis protein [Paucidesulfovibrio longus]